MFALNVHCFELSFSSSQTTLRTVGRCRVWRARWTSRKKSQSRSMSIGQTGSADWLIEGLDLEVPRSLLGAKSRDNTRIITSPYPPRLPASDCPQSGLGCDAIPDHPGAASIPAEPDFPFTASASLSSSKKAYRFVISPARRNLRDLPVPPIVSTSPDSFR